MIISNDYIILFRVFKTMFINFTLMFYVYDFLQYFYEKHKNLSNFIKYFCKNLHENFKKL